MDFKQLSDQQLVEHFSGKDGERILTEIYRRYWRRLLAIAQNHVNHQELAEELVQNVFIALWKRRDCLQVNQLSSYLATAIKYQVFSALKQKMRERARFTCLEDQNLQIPNDGDEQIYAQFLDQQIKGVVDQLPKTCKLVFRYSRQQGKANREIAETMNIAEKTVEGHLTKALKTLRSNLQQTGIWMISWCFFMLF